MPPAAYRALMLRSQALDRIYHLGAYNPIPAGITGAEYRALMVRSEALNKKYGLGPQNTAAPRTQATAAGGFSWTAFGIGAAAAVGLVLLLTAAIAARRPGNRHPSSQASH
jgi:hypothetical protein